jgi:hypothetical protein
MQDFYPNLSAWTNITLVDPITHWRGVVQPIQTDLRLKALLDDIDNDRPVYVRQGGRVEHDPDCKARHAHREWMEKVSNPYIAYELRVQYAGGKEHPRAYILNPTSQTDDTPHRFGDGAICAYPPWEDAWLWQEHTVVDFMDYVAIWLIKKTV